jgi:hypothetical protein
MSCCEPIEARPDDTVSKCPACGCDIDADGHTTETGCAWSPVACKKCGDRPCDQSC